VSLKGQLKLEVSADLLIEAKPQFDIEVPPQSTRTFEWPLVLGRKQALKLMDRPARVWLTLEGAKARESSFADVWALRWERQLPLVTNLKPGEVPIRIQNFLDRQITAGLDAGTSEKWEIVRPMKTDITLPAAADSRPATQTVSLQARLKPFAEHGPEAYRMPLKLKLAQKVFDAGYRLVETEKRREWYAAAPAPEIGAEFEPDMPTQPIDARKSKLWDLDWTFHERDTLIDFETPVGQRIFAVTNVRFIEDAEVSIRVRGDEKVDAWLAGDPLLTGKPKEGEVTEDLETIAHESVQVKSGQWLPLVIRYHRATAHPNTDLVFTNQNGEVIWSAEYRIAPKP